ncbi:MAG: hypothetical protein MSS61_06670, partial [Bacteroidales bacterium]|nr:hypothetical protein [Bacteroidales bacterium]
GGNGSFSGLRGIVFLLGISRGAFEKTTGRFIPPSIEGRFYKLVSMEGRASILLGYLHAYRAVSFFSFCHVARYAPS